MLIAYSIISILLISCYLVIISIYIYYWNRIKVWEYPPSFEPQTTVTVLVAARNEAASIKACLEALSGQDYPQDLLEICIIDDHSEDETARLIKNYLKPGSPFKYIALEGAAQGKKQAILAGIRQSEGELIVTTDADCIMEKDWLKYLVSYYEKHDAKFIAAPVTFYEEKSLFECFQSLDFMGMMAVSGAGIEGQFMNMCNGANLAYQRVAFNAVGGFEGIDHVASGDDMLLLQKIAHQYPDKIGYLKQPKAQTRTRAKSTIKGFVQQRIRWTSKSGAYEGWQVLFMLATVWLLCLSLFFDLFLMPYNTFFVYLFCAKFVLKGVADYFFLGMMARFFNRKELMRSFIPALFYHWWYIAIVGTLGNFLKEYKWKGRNVR